MGLFFSSVFLAYIFLTSTTIFVYLFLVQCRVLFGLTLSYFFPSCFSTFWSRASFKNNSTAVYHGPCCGDSKVCGVCAVALLFSIVCLNWRCRRDCSMLRVHCVLVQVFIWYMCLYNVLVFTILALMGLQYISVGCAHKIGHAYDIPDNMYFYNTEETLHTPWYKYGHSQNYPYPLKTHGIPMYSQGATNVTVVARQQRSTY